MADGMSCSASPVFLEECFPLDQPPASSTECISFSCHNVLQVCSRWIVYLYLSNSLNGPGTEIVPRHHPLCHFSDRDSSELVVGAKWSSTLVPEVRYPAESRLCVMTTSTLLIYRVTRHGHTRIEVSHGIGLGTPHVYRRAQRRQAGATGSPSKATPPPPPEASPSPPSPAETRGAKRKRAPPPTPPRRGRPRTRTAAALCDSPSSPETAQSEPDAAAEEAEEMSNQTSTDEQLDAELTTATSTEYVVLDAVWLPDDVLVVLTTAGLHILPFADDSADESEPVVRCLDAPTHAFADDLLGLQLAPPSCVSTVRTSPLLLSSGDANHPFLTHLVVVTSAFVSRVFLVDRERAALVHYVETPLINSVPSCVSALVDTAASDKVVDVTLLISCPTNTICGTFPMTRPPAKRRTATSGAQEADPTASPFTLRHRYDFPANAGDDPYLRGFQVVPVTSSAATMSATNAAPFLVFAVAQRAFYGLLLTNPVPSTLFRCPSLVTLDAVPSSSAVAVCGLTVHPSTTLAIALLHTGYIAYPALHLLPLSGSDPQSPLHRQLSLTGAFDGILDRYPDMEVRSAANCNNLYAQWLWQHQQDVRFFTWEPLFTLSTACTTLHSDADGRKYLSNKKTFLRELSTLTASTPTPHEPLWPAACVLRDQYRRLRETWGVKLFLRWPAPAGATDTQPTRATRSGESHWWYLLLQLWRQHPWDPSAMAELTLANAVRVLAAATHYARTSLRPDEAIRDLEDRCAPSASTLSVEAALCFVQLYVQEVQDCLSATTLAHAADDAQPLLRASAYTRAASPDSPHRTARRSATPLLLPWAATQTWRDTLQTFLNGIDGSAIRAKTNTRVRSMADMTTVRFPCSVCDAPSVATFNVTFRCPSVHPPCNADPDAAQAPPETHVTLFSGTTFSPLSLFCEDSVLTRCLGCGFADYATGPLCRLCGGLLL